MPNLPILVVEDNEDAAEMLAEYLGMFGYEVRTAGDGTTALSVVTAFTPRCAIVDLGLPDMDGYELSARMRAEHPQLGDMKIIALSGSAEASDKRRSLDAGFSAHLAKPVDLKALREVLRMHLQPKEA